MKCKLFGFSARYVGKISWERFKTLQKHVLLTGYDIDTIKESEYDDFISVERDDIDLSEVDGLAPSIINKLHAEGLETVQDVLEVGYDNLINIPGIADKTATKILDVLNNL